MLTVALTSEEEGPYIKPEEMPKNRLNQYQQNMAACIRKEIARCFLRDRHQVLTILTRGSRYDKNYIEATRNLEELQQPLTEDDIRRFRRIKAARTDDSTFADFDPVVQRFTNMVMEEGKKALARNIVAKTFENIKRMQLEKYHRADDVTKETIELDPITVFHQVVENGKPLLHTSKVVKGGAAYQVPIPCPPRRQEFKSLKWLVEVSKDKDKSMRFHDKLAHEILDAYYNQGRLIKKKQELLKACEANKAYAQYKYGT